MALELGFEARQCSGASKLLFCLKLSHNLSNGHTFFALPETIGRPQQQLIGVDSQAVNDALDALVDSSYIVRETVAGQDACYLDGYHEAETFVADRLFEMASNPADSAHNVKHLVTAVEREYGISYAQLQLKSS